VAAGLKGTVVGEAAVQVDHGEAGMLDQPVGRQSTRGHGGFALCPPLEWPCGGVDPGRGRALRRRHRTEPAAMMTAPTPTRPGFHLMAKPSGAACNLDCHYCFYLEKTERLGQEKQARMDDATLEAHIRQTIAATDDPEVQFAWQGGEPTLMGLDFFRRAVAIQEHYRPEGRSIVNTFQTNGVLLDDAWCAFLAGHKFLVGLSVDGPRELHDAMRIDKGGKPTFDKVMAAAERMRRHGVEFNSLTVVGRHNQEHALKVYRFLRKNVSPFMQFIPLVERAVPGATDHRLSGPPGAPSEEHDATVTPWSVQSDAWGRFMCTVYDEWVRADVGTVFVQAFDTALGAWMGLPAALCIHAETCGRALIIEHNGDVFSCDHFAYPEFKLGNVKTDNLRAMVDSPQQKAFGDAKRDTLPGKCRRCPVLHACRGGCPKHRFLKTEDGEPGLHYLCAGYFRFFTHVDEGMRRMAALLHQQKPPAEIMKNPPAPLITLR
jgi:uncharacterized protein